MNFLFLVVCLVVSSCTHISGKRNISSARTNVFCGERYGTAGNAYLIGKKGIELARQGRSQTLLEQADRVIESLGPDKNGETGVQNGTRYCLRAEVTRQKKPIRIISGWRMGDRVETFCGIRMGTAGNAYLMGEREIWLAMQGGDQTLLEQADKMIQALGRDENGESGMQNGDRYCVNAKVSGEDFVKIIHAYRMN